MNVAMIPPVDNIQVPWTCPTCAQNAESCRQRATQYAEFILKVARLSDRERQVMIAICAGTSPNVTAERLGISVKTVHTYRARILEKLELKTNTQIAVMCERSGILEGSGILDG